MRQLIWKDIVLQKKTARVYVLLGLFMLFFLTTAADSNVMAIMVPSFMIVYSFVNRSMLEDERNNTVRMLLCLPIPRSRLVKAKYGTVLLVASAAALFFVLVGQLTGLISLLQVVQSWENAFAMALMALIFTAMISIFIPLVYKVGIVKAQTFSRLLFFGIMTLSLGLGALMKLIQEHFDFSSNPPAWIEAIGGMLEQINPYAGLTLLYALTVLVFVGSMLLSIRFFERREVF